MNKSGRAVFAHHPFDDASEGIQRAQRLEGMGKDAYFAMASFKVKQVLDAKGGFMKSYRKQENVAALKSLYIDIDFKEYQTETDAVNALKTFLDTTRIPKPTVIVHSGGGLHVYWTFDRAVSPDEWKPLAIALASLGQKHSLKADWQCTIDSARVLRMPGTLNFKYTPARAVRVLQSKPDDYPFESLRDFLEPHIQTATKATAAARPSADVIQLFGPADNKELVANYDPGFRYLMGPIIEKCPVLSDVMATNGAGNDYPFWKDTLHLAAYTHDGRDYIHELSKGHADYNFDETEERFQESADVARENSRGPTTCERFSKHSSKCLACSYWGHIKSPISLGLERPATEAAEITYVLQNKTYVNVTTDDGVVERKLICNTGLQNWRYGEDVLMGAYLQFDAVAPGMERTITLECRQLNDPRYIRSELAAQGVAVYAGQVKMLEHVMYSYMEKLRDRGDEAEAAPAFGWIHHPKTKATTGFAYAGTIHKLDGATALAGLIDDSLSDAYCVSGDPAPWEAVMDRLVQDPRGEIQCILATAFAAPLMRFSQAGSFTVSACSRKSGVGKSTALAAAQAVWGHPVKGMNSLNDTSASIARKMSQLRDLPSYWDELRMKEQVEGFVKLVFQINQGKERQRLTSSAKMRRAEEINTFLVVATNEPVMGVMLEHTRLSDAGMMRLFEFPVPNLPGGNKLDTEFARKVNQLKSHHGHAGLAYSKYLAANFAHVQKVYESVDRQLLAMLEPRPEERFWFQGVVCLVAGSILAGSAGICQIDVKRLVDFCKTRFDSARAGIIAEREMQRDLVANMLSYYSNDVLVTRHLQRNGGTAGGSKSWTNEVLRFPRAQVVRAQIGTADEGIWIPFSTLEHYATIAHMNVRSLKEMLEESYGATRRRVTPGAGTSYASGQTTVMEISSKVLGDEALANWQAGVNDDLKANRTS